MILPTPFDDPHAVLISRTPIADPPTWDDYRFAAERAVQALAPAVAGRRVVVKPNVTIGERFADPDSGITTHPAFVAGLLATLADHGARRGALYIVEDPRNVDDESPRHWQGTGYVEEAARVGAHLRCPNMRSCVWVDVPDPLVHPRRRVSRLAVEPNTMLVNVPKLKTHNLAITTLCLKNLMGLDLAYDRHYCAQAMRELPPELRHDDLPRHEWMDRALHERWQEGLARRLADLAKVVRPDLNVVEGVVGRDGTGFQRGENIPLGLVVAGANMVAVDAVASYLMGFDPQQLIYLRVAHAAGLGEHDLDRLRVYEVGDDGRPYLCASLDAHRAEPPFRVISGIVGEGPMGPHAPIAAPVSARVKT